MDEIVLDADGSDGSEPEIIEAAAGPRRKRRRTAKPSAADIHRPWLIAVFSSAQCWQKPDKGIGPQATLGVLGSVAQAWGKSGLQGRAHVCGANFARAGGVAD